MTQSNRMSRGARVRSRMTGVGLALGGCLLAVAACTGSTEDGGDGSGGADGTGGFDGTGAANPGSGGVIGDGGTGGTTGGAGGLGGLGGFGGAGAVCSLPFEVGFCDALIPVYFHNSATGRCEPATYGGCGGNENRFESFTECQDFCGVEPTGAACQVGDIVYPDGFGGVPDPTSCNTCACSDGQIDACTEIGCEEPCPEGTIRATDCTWCAPNDACLIQRTDCLPACDNQDDCAESGGFCSDGACRMVCG